MSEQDPHQREKQERPFLLKVLCILTFLGSGTSALANNIMYFTAGDWKAAYEQGLFENLSTWLDTEALQVLLNVDPLFFLAQFLLYLLSAGGALLMWNMRRIGFHLYTIAQILLLINYNLFMTSQPFPLFPLLLSVTFILLYSRNLSVMH